MIFIRYAEIRRLLAEKRRLIAKIAELESELRDERNRNRRREDDLVNQVLLAAGRYGVEPSKPKPKAEPVVKPRPRLNAVQDATLKAYRKAAVEAGRSVQEADAVFWAELEGKPIPITQPDEPYILPT